MRTVWREVEKLIDEVENAGYDLEMAIESKDDRSKDAQKRVRRFVTLVKALKKVKTMALELGI